MTDLGAWLALLALGAFHGINPAMGWLFAVGLGMQQKRRAAVLEALLPIAVGHALSIALVVLVVLLLGIVSPLEWLRWSAGVALILFGAYKLVRARHPRWVGMQVGFRDLVTWSFLMATAHGAGLMLVPVLLSWDAGTHHLEYAHGPGQGLHHHASGHTMDGHAEGHSGHASVFMALSRTPLLALLATVVHTLGYLTVMATVAIVVYEKIGLSMLRKAWFNLDIVWAVALMLTGLATLVV